MWVANLIGLAFCAVLFAAGLAPFANYRQITYPMSWLGLRLQGHTSVPERLVRATNYKTRIGRSGGLFLMILGAAGAAATLVQIILAP
jgi:hypothetical protein